MSSLEQSDKEAAAHAVAPRVTLAAINAAVKNTYYISGGAISGQAKDNILTICMVELQNGWCCVGKSAPASPENFNEEFGKKLAYEDCIRQLWPLMGFALKEKQALYERYPDL